MTGMEPRKTAILIFRFLALASVVYGATYLPAYVFFAAATGGLAHVVGWGGIVAAGVSVQLVTHWLVSGETYIPPYVFLAGIDRLEALALALGCTAFLAAGIALWRITNWLVDRTIPTDASGVPSDARKRQAIDLGAVAICTVGLLAVGRVGPNFAYLAWAAFQSGMPSAFLPALTIPAVNSLVGGFLIFFAHRISRVLVGRLVR